MAHMTSNLRLPTKPSELLSGVVQTSLGTDGLRGAPPNEQAPLRGFMDRGQNPG